MADENLNKPKETLWQQAKAKSEVFSHNVFVEHYSNEALKIGLGGSIFSFSTGWNDKGLLSLWLSIACLQKQIRDLQEGITEDIIELEDTIMENQHNKRINKTIQIIRMLERHPNMLQKEIAKKLNVSEVLVCKVKKKYKPDKALSAVNQQ